MVDVFWREQPRGLVEFEGGRSKNCFFFGQVGMVERTLFAFAFSFFYLSGSWGRIL